MTYIDQNSIPLMVDFDLYHERLMDIRWYIFSNRPCDDGGKHSARLTIRNKISKFQCRKCGRQISCVFDRAIRHELTLAGMAIETFDEELYQRRLGARAMPLKTHQQYLKRPRPRPPGHMRIMRTWPPAWTRDMYEQYLRSEVWSRRVCDCRRRYNGRCAVCTSEHELHVHHRTYDRLGREDPRDLTLLCSDCHGLVHGRGKWIRELELKTDW